MVLLLHSGYVSMPTDFGVSWRRDFTRHTQNHTATIFVQCLGASFSAQVWRLVRELDERFSYSTRKVDVYTYTQGCSMNEKMTRLADFGDIDGLTVFILYHFVLGEQV